MRRAQVNYPANTAVIVIAFLVAAFALMTLLGFHQSGFGILLPAFLGITVEMKEAREKAAAKFKEANDFYETKKDKSGELSAEDAKNFDLILADAKKLDEEYTSFAKKGEKIEGLKERLSFYHEAATGRQIPFGDGVRITQSPKSMGQQFVDSMEYKALRESGALASDNANFKTSPFKTEMKATTDVINTTSGNPGAALVIPQYLPGILPLPQRPLTIRDLFSQDTTETDVLSYAAQSAFDTGAAPVAQATSLATGAKPQSSIAWQRRTTPIEAIATWMAATRRQLSDVGQTRSLVDNQLQLMLKIAEEDQLLTGNGTSPNLRGLANTSGVLTYDISGAASAKFQNIDAVRHAIRLIRTGVARVDPDFVVMNPADVEVLDTQKDDQHRYIGNGPFDVGPGRLWRRPIVESEAVTSGTAWVGAWKIGGTVFQREAVAIFASDSHSDFFIRNLVAVLAEERLGLAIYFPAAFCLVTFKTPWA